MMRPALLAVIVAVVLVLTSCNSPAATVKAQNTPPPLDLIWKYQGTQVYYISHSGNDCYVAIMAVNPAYTAAISCVTADGWHER